MFDFLALESDAINANFDLVYSDAEIENHVRNWDRRTAQYHGRTTIYEYIVCISMKHSAYVLVQAVHGLCTIDPWQGSLAKMDGCLKVFHRTGFVSVDFGQQACI